MEIIEIAPLLFILALLAGLVDAVAGGGGLITVPALLWVGLAPVAALATNKAQGVFGTLASTLHFVRQGAIDLSTVASAVACTFAGASAGAIAVHFLATDVLSRLVPLLLIGFALYFLFSPRVADIDARQRIGHRAFGLLIGTGVGFYDGFFGPGTGTFFAIGYVALLGYNLRSATAHAKLLNFTSNLAACLFFITAGHVLWGIAIIMAAGQFLGGWLGAHLVIRHGTRLVRPVLVAVSLLISLKLLLQAGG
ncbi:MAG TPA: hypothetical protein DDY14_10925 [Chromatiaceae bacterium]|nr:MAG: TSUP family transporter [Thiohalocapsa sp. PB-PSB1]HBG95806.1 hypothetical protein [Chromatiaceae bacterium]HCS91370.1 hypothetical protein [Chromatiaceae bacterium]